MTENRLVRKGIAAHMSVRPLRVRTWYCIPFDSNRMTWEAAGCAAAMAANSKQVLHPARNLPIVCPMIRESTAVFG